MWAARRGRENTTVEAGRRRECPSGEFDGMESRTAGVQECLTSLGPRSFDFNDLGAREGGTVSHLISAASGEWRALPAGRQVARNEGTPGA